MSSQDGDGDGQKLLLLIHAGWFARVWCGWQGSRVIPAGSEVWTLGRYRASPRATRHPPSHQRTVKGGHSLGAHICTAWVLNNQCSGTHLVLYLAPTWYPTWYLSSHQPGYGCKLSNAKLPRSAMMAICAHWTRLVGRSTTKTVYCFLIGQCLKCGRSYKRREVC